MFTGIKIKSNEKRKGKKILTGQMPKKIRQTHFLFPLNGKKINKKTSCTNIFRAEDLNNN